jgi:DNA-binding transcriptional MerR regulator/effector-binding domain-containing protein
MTGLVAGPAGTLTVAGSRISAMPVRLAIGDFSRMTHLSVKALRHYHDVGLLTPAEIDPSSGYRFYEPSQLSVAQVIRRFRDLDMPLDEIRAMLAAPDVATRNQVIVAHLQRMESQLAVTQAAISSLRSLLERPAAPLAVEHRSVGRARALAITERVSEADLEGWWLGAFTELDAALRTAGVAPAGPRGALYPAELFEQEVGDIVAFVPVPTDVTGTGRARMTEIPAAELVVAVHRGAFGDLDQTYAALGVYVAQREIGVEGPIRELYLVSPFETSDDSAHVTEVCWPVFRTAPAS